VTTFSFPDYYGGERNAGLALTLIGVASAVAATWLLGALGPLAAMAWPLAVGALLGLGVGTGMAFNAHRELTQRPTRMAEAIVALDAKLVGQARTYRSATRVELALTVIAALLTLRSSGATTFQALSFGVLVEGGRFLCFDTLGLRRATRRLEQLRTSVTTPASDRRPT
jgi:hypothetical protein